MERLCATIGQGSIRFNERGDEQWPTRQTLPPKSGAALLRLQWSLGIAITAAEPSGLWGLLQEGMAGGRALLKAKQDTSTNALVKAVVDDFANGDARTIAQERVQTIFKGAQAADLARRAVDELRSLASLLDFKAREDSQAFKSWLQEIAQKAAESAKEGGFPDLAELQERCREATLAVIAAALQSSSSGRRLEVASVRHLAIEGWLCVTEDVRDVPFQTALFQSLVVSLPLACRAFPSSRGPEP